MKTKKMPKIMMIGIMMFSLLTPYQGVFAAGNDDGNGDATTNRYLDYKLLDGSNELTEPSPVLASGVNEKSYTVVVNHKAGELNGRDAKIQYRVTGAGGVEYKREMVLSGTVGSAFFPSTRVDNSFKFTLKIKRGGTCGAKEVCLPVNDAHYNLAVDVVFNANDGTEQTFTSLNKTIYVNGEKGYEKDDTTNYSQAAGKLQYNVYRIATNGSLSGFNTVTYGDLNSDKPVPIFIDGYYQPDANIAVGKTVQVNYDIYAIESQSNAHLVKHFEQTQATGTGTNYIEFNRKLHLSNEANQGNTKHSGYLDVAYLNNYPMQYVLRVSVKVKGEAKARVVLDKPINVTDTSYKKPDYITTTSKALPAVASGKNISFTLTNDTGTQIHDLDLSKLRLRDGVKGNMLGGILLPDIPVGKEVRVEYALQTFDENYVNSNDKIVTKYVQNAETMSNATGYNKEIYFRVGNKDPLDTRPVIYLKDYIAEYVLKVDLIYGEGNQVKDTLYWKINLVNDTVTHRIDADEHAPYNRKNEFIDFDLNQVTKNASGSITARTAFKTALVNQLNMTPKELEIRGTLKSPQIVGVGTQFKIGYEVAAIEDYSTNTIVKKYIQDVNVRGNEVEFNRLFTLTTEQNQLYNGSKKDYVYVENYPSNYVVRVFLEDNTGKTHYYMDKQISLTDDSGKVQNNINYLLPQTAKTVPSFTYPTRLDVSLQQYDTSGNLKAFKEAKAADIEKTPLKLNIQSLLRNSDAIGSNMEIRFDVVSYESYLDAYANNVLKKYTQNTETQTYHVEANRDIFISTNTRLDRSNDNRESTIYLEDETQYYQLRIEVLKNGQTFMKREVPFKINGIVDPDHKAPQDMTGPEADPNAQISTFLTDPNNSNKATKRLQITARELNSKDGIGVDLQGYIKKSWENQQVLVRYDLVALNTYTDYINGNGVTTTLETDPQAQPDDQNHVLVGTMTEWYGKASQNNFLKRYQSTNYTKDNYEQFTKHLVLRTKLDQDKHGTSPSTWFLDNAARDYDLTITAKNMSTGETIKETIQLDITTVKKAQNHAPEFGSKVSFRQPARGTGYFEGEFMPVSFYAASDADNTNNQTEYLYYKVYYYYSTSNESGVLNNEIQKYMLRYDDMPMGGGVLSTEWQVPMSAKIEPAYLRGYACDVNHVCSEATKSNPFKFNEFGVGEGSSGGGSGSGISANIIISPKPTGEWENKAKEVFVNYEGSAELAVGANKTYTITNSSSMPGAFNKALTTDNKIVIDQEGENYVHVRYILSDGTELYTSSGPYRIFKSGLSDFTLKLVDASGKDVTGWTNKPPYLKMTYGGNETNDGVVRQYRVHGYDIEWKEANAQTRVNVEGEQTIYARMKNKAGTASEEKGITSKLDVSPVNFRKVALTEKENGTYDISVWAEDTLSGIKRLTVVDNGVTKELELSPSNGLYQLTGLKNAPTSVKAFDNAGNEISVNFTNKPTITFDSPYKTDSAVYRDTVKGKITNGVDLSYKLGSQTFTCGSQSPCPFTIDRNTLFTGINTDGIKQTNKEIRINNIDKKELNLLLYGKRQASDANKIDLNWNYNITNGILSCYKGGQKINDISATGTGVTVNFGNAIVDCQLKGNYGGDLIVSNRVVIYPDSSKPVEGGGSGKVEIDEKIYVEESRIGTSYFINTKRGNTEEGYAPLPEELFPE